MGRRTDDSKEKEPIVLSEKAIPGGNRKMVFGQCEEYLVIDQVGGEIVNVQSFDEREFMLAAAAFKAEAGGNNEESVEFNREYHPLVGARVYGIPRHAVGLP